MKSRLRLASRVLVAVCLTQDGCSFLQPKPDSSRYYLLAPLSETGTGAGQDETLAGGPSLGIGPIVLPGYLDREHIVIRLSPNRVQISDFDRWAEPLHASFQRVLASDLATLLGTEKITPYPFRGPAPDYEVQIDVTRFEPMSDHSAGLAARWSVKDGKTKQVVLTRDTSVVRPAKESSIAGSVAALSEALGELSREIAAAVRQIHSQPSSTRRP